MWKVDDEAGLNDRLLRQMPAAGHAERAPGVMAHGGSGREGAVSVGLRRRARRRGRPYDPGASAPRHSRGCRALRTAGHKKGHHQQVHARQSAEGPRGAPQLVSQFFVDKLAAITGYHRNVAR